MDGYKRIDSKANNLVKKIIRLANERQFRQDSQLAVIYGEHLLIEANKFGLLQHVLLASSELEKYAKLLASLQNVEISLVSSEVIQKINCLDFQAPLVGVIHLVRSELAAADLNSDCLLLEQIQDPGNLGTILRAAAASGIKTVILSANSVDSSNPKVLRASQGIQFNLKILSNVNLAEFIHTYQGQVLAMSPHAKASLYQQNLTKKTALLLGNEGNGLSLELLGLVSQQISIPMGGNSESLNLAMAATIALFEMSRQRLVLGPL